MKVIFFTPKNIAHPARLLGIVALPMIRRVAIGVAAPALLATGVMLMFFHWPLTRSLLLGAGPIMLAAFFVGIIGAVHELAHAYAGVRLVGPDYVVAVVLPTFRTPFVRFAASRPDVPAPHVAVILLIGSISGLCISALIMLVLLILPIWGSFRWVAWGYWAALAFSQITSLIPVGPTDGSKVRQLKLEKALTWSTIGRAALDLIRGPSRGVTSLGQQDVTSC